MAAATGEGVLWDRPDADGPRPGPGARPRTGPGLATDAPTDAGPGPRRTPRHEIRALLRAHLAAASGYRHLTRHCVVRARLLQLAMEPVTASSAAEPAKGSPGPARPPTGRQGAATRPPVTPPGPGEPIRARWTRDQSPPAA